MKTLVCERPGKFSFVERSVPQLEKNHAILKIKRIGVCGTDLHAYEGTQPYFTYPRVLGHELAGELMDADDASGFAKGEIVTFIPYFYCGKCVACRSGVTNCCIDLKVSGVHIDGGMTEYLSVPSYSLVHGEGLSLDELALIEPLAIGAHAIRRSVIRKDEFVLVIGAGPIGLGVMEFARIAGGKVLAMDINERRLAFCRENLNVHQTIHVSAMDAGERIREITSGDMPTVVIDATGNLNAINNGFQYIAHGGRYILVGLQKEGITVSHPEFHKREATLMSSRNATREDFMHVIKCMKEGLINPAYITHKVRFELVANEFETWLKPASGVIKAMISIE